MASTPAVQSQFPSNGSISTDLTVTGTAGLNVVNLPAFTGEQRQFDTDRASGHILRPQHFGEFQSARRKHHCERLEECILSGRAQRFANAVAPRLRKNHFKYSSTTGQ